MHSALIPWLDPEILIQGFGAFALLGICVIVFAETGLLVGFLLPGDTLLIITGVLTFQGVIDISIWWVCLAIGGAAILGGEVGYLIGHRLGPRVFERKESGFFSVRNVERTNQFFERFGPIAVVIARFVPVVRTFAPVAAGVGHMHYGKYSIYNTVGALVWGAGLTYAGFLLGYIPPIADFVRSYIDVILLGVIVLTLIPTVYHYVRMSMKAKKNARAEEAESVDGVGAAEKLVLEPEVFTRKND